MPPSVRNVKSGYTRGSSLHAALQPQSAAKYEPIQMYNARNFILDILDDPDRHIEHARRYVPGRCDGGTLLKCVILDMLPASSCP